MTTDEHRTAGSREVGMFNRYTPKHDGKFRFKHEDGRDFPLWMRNVALGGFREQGWAAYQQPGGKKIATGAWGDSLILKRDGSIASTARSNPNA